MPFIIAHRGASADFHENTVAAFHGARNQGADWVELDVRLNAEGELIVNHDAVFADQRVVWSTPTVEIPETVPTLAEALDACSGMGVNIELKNTPGDLGIIDGIPVPHSTDIVEAVVALIAKRRAAGDTQELLISSFDGETLTRTREVAPDLPTGCLTGDLHADPEQVDRAALEGHVAVHPWYPFVDAAFVERSVGLNLQINTWTVDEPEDIVNLAKLGVHGIITNHPGAARSVLEKQGIF